MLIAMSIVLVALLGLLQAALLGIDNNMRNLLRDEAVRLAEEQMNVFKSLPINDIAYNPPTSAGLAATTNKAVYSTGNGNAIVRYFGSFNASYAVYLTIVNLTSDHSKKSIQVYVGWSYKDQYPALTPTQQEYQYVISSIVSSNE